MHVTFWAEAPAISAMTRSRGAASAAARSLVAGAFLAAALAGPAAAHSPIMTCYDNGDETVTCEAGFSDGASATGSQIALMTEDQRLLGAGEVDEAGGYTFDYPDADFFEIQFISDSAHTLTLYSDEIVPYEE